MEATTCRYWFSVKHGSWGTIWPWASQKRRACKRSHRSFLTHSTAAWWTDTYLVQKLTGLAKELSNLWAKQRPFRSSRVVSTLGWLVRLWITYVIKYGNLVYPGRSSDAFRTARRNISSMITRKCIQKGNIARYGCNAHGCQGESGERCYMSTIWGYFCFIHFVGWSQALLASDSKPLVTFSLTCPVPPYRTVFNPYMLRLASNERKRKDVVNMRSKFPVRYDQAKAVWEVFVQVHTYTFGCGRSSSYCDWPVRPGESISNFQKKSWSVPCTEIRYFLQWCDFLLRCFFWRPYVLQQPGPHISRHEWQSSDGRCGLWKERRMFEFSPRFRRHHATEVLRVHPPPRQSKFGYVMGVRLVSRSKPWFCLRSMFLPMIIIVFH